MGWPDFGINLSVNPAEWFGEDRGDEQRGQNVALQREFRDHAESREDSFLQRRVDQAKAAGLHPLFALSGGSGGSTPFSPNPVTVSEGTSVGAQFSPGAPRGARNAAEARQADPGERFAQLLAEQQGNDNHARTISTIRTDTEQQGLLRAQADLVRQQLKDSVDSRAGQAGRYNQERSALNSSPTNPEDAYEVKPREVMQGTQASGGSIGVGPASAGFEPVWIAPGLPALVPAGAAQNLGDMEFTGWLVSAAATMLWWGDAASRKVVEQARRAGSYLFTGEVAKEAERMRSEFGQFSGGAP